MRQSARWTWTIWSSSQIYESATLSLLCLFVVKGLSGAVSTLRRTWSGALSFGRTWSASLRLPAFPSSLVMRVSCKEDQAELRVMYHCLVNDHIRNGRLASIESIVLVLILLFIAGCFCDIVPGPEILCWSALEDQRK